MAASSHQLKAAHDSSRIVQLVAGPGTGKSSSIEERVLWLLRQGEPADSIYAFSFTNLASEDLASRIRSHVSANGYGAVANKIVVSTVHALALRMLSKANILTSGFPAKPSIMDDVEVKTIFDAEYSKHSNITPTEAGKTREAYEASWDTLNSNSLQPIPVAQQAVFHAFHDRFKRVYCTMLPGETVKLCVDSIKLGVFDPVEITGIGHLIVDEFQDLNACDQAFVEYFHKAGATLFVAGDDDQSLYSFRNAAPDGLINFATNYPGTSSHSLPDCYRCTPSVINPALSLVSINMPRLSKKLTSIYATNGSKIQGVFEVNRYTKGKIEASSIAESCRNLIAAGIPAKEIFILLAKKDLQLPLIKAALDSLKVPYESPAANDLRDSPGGRVIYSILRIICNADDYLCYRTLLASIPRVGVGTCATIREKIANGNHNYKSVFTGNLPPGLFKGGELNIISAVIALYQTISAWQVNDTLYQRGNDINDAISNFFNATGNIGCDACNEAIGLLHNEILPVLPAETTLDEVLKYVRTESNVGKQNIINSIAARIGADGVEPDSIDAVKILTYHSSKGLSAYFVFMPGMEDGIIPDKYALLSGGLINEKRRILYVGITRARLGCFLSYAQTRDGAQAVRLGKTKLPVSQFVMELKQPVTPKIGGLPMTQAKQLATDYLAMKR